MTLNVTTGPEGQSNWVLLYKNHGANIGSWEMWTDGATMHNRSYKKLGGNPITSQKEATAKNIGRSNETTPETQALLEVLSKARKQLLKGYVLNLEAAKLPVTNTLGLKQPMLATPLNKVKPESIDWEHAYVQPKLDGHRGLFDGELYSRGGKSINLPHIDDAIAQSGLDHLHLDGELYVHGRPLQEISRLIKKLTPESFAVQYWIYDVVQDAPFVDRGKNLAMAEIANMGLADQIVLVPTYKVDSMEEAMEWHKKWRSEGYEGTMLRFSTDPYKVGKRSRTLLKIKEFQDAEFEVIGYTDCTPRVTDDMVWQCPKWICQVPGHGTFEVTAQGDAAEKHAQHLGAASLLGKLLKVRFHYYSKDQIPQLPVALGWYEEL